MAATLQRSLTSMLRISLLSFPSLRSISFTPKSHQNPQTLAPPSPPPPPPLAPLPANTNPSPRTRTPLEKQFETWVEKLKPGFTPSDVEEALRSQSDPDLALDIFRWTAQQRRYKHNHATYLAMIQISASGRLS